MSETLEKVVIALDPDKILDLDEELSGCSEIIAELYHYHSLNIHDVVFRIRGTRSVSRTFYTGIDIDKAKGVYAEKKRLFEEGRYVYIDISAPFLGIKFNESVPK